MSAFNATRPATTLSFTSGDRQSKYMRHEEKQENIARFCGYFLDRLSVRENPTDVERRVTLLARSPLSPVARAVHEALGEMVALGVALQVLFAKVDQPENLAPWLDSAVAHGGMLDLRWARRPALIDAHEQLVLGLGLSWAGDSMRREPEKRDAYEQFDTFDLAAAARAEASFASFWTMSEKIVSRRTSIPAVFSLPDSVHASLVGLQPDTGATTRH